MKSTMILYIVLSFVLAFTGLEKPTLAFDSEALLRSSPMAKMPTCRQARRALKKASGYSNAKKAALQDTLFGSASPATVYLAAFTVMPAEDGTGATEVSGSGYARISITNNATNFPASTSANPSIKELATQESFPQATADWMSAANVVGFGFYDANTSGTFLASAYAMSTPQIATADPTTNLFTTGAAHGFSANDAVAFQISSGGTMPSPINIYSTTAAYYVISSGLTATAFKISATQGGSAITITTYVIAGVMRVFKSFIGPVKNQATLTINANQLQFQLSGF